MTRGTDSNRVCIIVLAHNEERRIGACLSSVHPVPPHHTIHAVVNGSNDRTAEIARTFDGVDVHDWEQGGKSRSWNRIMLDTPGIEADAYIFVDGDAVVLPGSVEALASTLERSGANAASGLPANGRQAAVYRQSIARQHGMFGDLYALSGDFVRRFRASGIRLPEDLIGDDGLIGALAKTDFGPDSEWNDERVATCEAAGFLCEPVDLSARAIRMQASRMRNYSLRHFQNRIVSDIMRSEGPKGLPRTLATLYAGALPDFRPRLDPRYWWFDRQALAAMRQLATHDDAALTTSPA